MRLLYLIDWKEILLVNENLIDWKDFLPIDEV
jgi:hypothetical protein